MALSKEIENLLGNDGSDKASLINPREFAALLESLGYGDRYAKGEGFSDIFSLAEDLFSRFRPDLKPENRTPGKLETLSTWDEIRCALRKFSVSLSYAVPWMALLVLEYLKPNALKVQPELGGALSLALIASLISTGGFVQMISRSGALYFGLKEPFLARHSCVAIVNAGLTCSLLVGSLGMMIGAYFRVFGGPYLMLAAINYLAFSLLWMFCAMLSVAGIAWCVPPVFLLSGLLCGLIKAVFGVDNGILLTLWPVLAVVCALGCVFAGFGRFEKRFPESRNSARPRFGVLSISLAPFYLYGTLYFSFLFADRLTAGSAVSWVSGLSFGVNPAYKSGMDMALLVFLITAALVEYLSDSFMRFWRGLAAELPRAKHEELVASLRRRHAETIAVIVAVFVLFSIGASFAFSRVINVAHSPVLLQTAALGGLGYLLVSIALLEIVILASINATSLTLANVGVALCVNLVIGYGLSHLCGVQYAAAGLLAGSLILMWKCNATVRGVLKHPDYHYSIS